MLTFYKIDLISSKGTIMTVFVRVQFFRRNRTSNLHAGMSLSRKLFYLSVSWRGKPFKNCKADVYHFSAQCKTLPIGGSDTCIWYEFWDFIVLWRLKGWSTKKARKGGKSDSILAISLLENSIWILGLEGQLGVTIMVSIIDQNANFFHSISVFTTESSTFFFQSWT